MQQNCHALEHIGDLEGDADRVLLRYDQRYFRVGKAVWAAVDLLQRGEGRGSVSDRLFHAYPQTRGRDQEHPALRSADRLLGTLDAPGSPRRAITGRLEVEVARVVDPLARWIAPVATRPVAFLALFAVLALVNALAYALLPSVASTHPARDALIAASAMFAIMSAHELAHAAVARALGCRAHRIGLGLFLLLPVFYADVSEIWRLRPHRRVLVNLAGVTVQLMIGVALAAASVSDLSFSGIARTLFVINLISVMVNLLPFAKLDGYWIAADLMNVPDLQSRSWARLKRIIRRDDPSEPEADRVALLLYATGLALFVGYVVVHLAMWAAGIASALLRDPAHGFASATGTPLAWLFSCYVLLRLLRATAGPITTALKRLAR
jgi:Zn-dependent protease